MNPNQLRNVASLVLGMVLGLRKLYSLLCATSLAARVALRQEVVSTCDIRTVQQQQHTERGPQQRSSWRHHSPFVRSLASVRAACHQQSRTLAGFHCPVCVCACVCI